MKWRQGGFNFAQSGDAPAPLTIEDRLWIGNPDVLFIPIGGGVKDDNAQEVVSEVDILEPQVVITVKYQQKDKEKKFSLWSKMNWTIFRSTEN